MSHSTVFSKNNIKDDEKVTDVLESRIKNIYKTDVDDNSFQHSQSVTDGQDDGYTRDKTKEKKAQQRKKFVKSKSKSSYAPRVSSASSAATELDTAKPEELSEIFNQYCSMFIKINFNFAFFVYIVIKGESAHNESSNTLVHSDHQR